MEAPLIFVVMVLVIAAAIAGGWLLWLLAAHTEPQYFVRAPGPATAPKCPDCDYELYYAEDQRCPECGRTFNVKELDMRLADWDGKILQPKKNT